jgi:hypothetical protein
MRPYTVVVLSDFGRDRMSYLAYDRLFSPELDPINLPVKNRYVLRMQATYSFMDWLATQVTVGGKFPNVWGYLSDTNANKFTQPAQSAALTIITNILENGHMRGHLRRHLMWSLGLDEREVEGLFWSAPRSLLLHVLPTLHRQLTSWLNEEIPAAAVTRGRPLHDFVPQAMFNELLLPEVEMRVPAPTSNRPARTETLGIAQSLRDFVPGKFSRRYGFTHGTESHWIPVQPTAGVATIALPGNEYEGDWLPAVTVRNDDGSSRSISVLRPTAMNLSLAKNLSPSTNASPRWKHDIESENPYEVELTSSPWVRSIIEAVDLYCHSLGGLLHVCRYMETCDGRLVDNRGKETVYETTFTDPEGEPAALGMVLDVDGIRVRLVEQEAALLLESGAGPAVMASWLAHLFATNANMVGTNSFDRDWLRLVVLGAIAKVDETTSLTAAWEINLADPDRDLLRKAARELLGAEPPEDDPELLVQVLDWLADDDVLQAISTILARAVPTDPDFGAFVARRYSATVAGAFVEAMMALNPSMVPEDVMVDVCVPGNDEVKDFLGFWVSESEAGSSGIVEAFATQYQNDPKLFWRLFERALDPSDLELSDSRLAHALDLSRSDGEVSAAWAGVRTSLGQGIESYRAALAGLYDLLEERGVDVDHSVRTALASRLLAAGTLPAHDALRLELRTAWMTLEGRYGIELDMRSAACRWAEDSRHDALIQSGAVSPGVRHGFFANLLWARGGDVRAVQFDVPQLFGVSPSPDRLLVPAPPRTTVPLSEGRAVFDAALMADGEVTILALPAEKTQLATLLREMATTPTDTGFLNLHPRVTSVMSRGGEIHCHLELVEATR